jgi:hypothetical protein
MQLAAWPILHVPVSTSGQQAGRPVTRLYNPSSASETRNAILVFKYSVPHCELLQTVRKTLDWIEQKKATFFMCFPKMLPFRFFRRRDMSKDNAPDRVNCEAIHVCVCVTVSDTFGDWALLEPLKEVQLY